MGLYMRVNSLFDDGMVALGETDEEMFEAACMGLSDCIIDVGSIDGRFTYHIEASGSNRREMLVNLLSNLLRIFKDDGFIFGRFDIRFFECRGVGVEMWAYGEPVWHPEGKHEIKNKIKEVRHPDREYLFSGQLQKSELYPSVGEFEIEFE